MSHLPPGFLDDYRDSSSLDPLSISFLEEKSPRLPRSSSIRRPSTSPSKSRKFIDNITVETPHMPKRRMSQAANSNTRTVSEQMMSPWKIRVTVEAEPENKSMEKSRALARTEKVPLKDDDSPTRARSARGRNKWMGSLAAQEPEPLTGRRRSVSRGRRQGVTDLDITVLGDDETEWKQRKQSRRKSRQIKCKKVVEQKEVESTGLPLDHRDCLPESAVPRRKGARSAKPDFDVRGDADAEEAGERLDQSPFDQYRTELRPIDTNTVSIRQRPHFYKGTMSAGGGNTSSSKPSISKLSSSPNPRQISGATAVSYPTPAPSIQEETEPAALAENPTEHHEGLDTILESEGFTMIDLDSISSARHFVTSPTTVTPQEGRSRVQAPSSQEKVSEEHAPYPSSSPLKSGSPAHSPQLPLPQLTDQKRPKPFPSYLTLGEGESDLSSTVPSSPPVQTVTSTAVPAIRPDPPIPHKTPAPYSSPSLPSPPKPPAQASFSTPSSGRKPSAPKLARVVRAGIALQGVLSPRHASSRAKSRLSTCTNLSSSSPIERLDGIFDGFDASTRRELKAGLRFGEELAKRQMSSSPTDAENIPQKSIPETRIWRGETVIQHTRISAASKEGEMVEKRHSSPIVTGSAQAERMKSTPSNAMKEMTRTPVQVSSERRMPQYRNTVERERQWQLEREAVSRQIENANTSQVIVLDGDGDGDDGSTETRCASENSPNKGEKSILEDESEYDIWLAQARVCDASQRTGQTKEADAELRQQQESSKVQGKPRSLIPSPWKRDEDVDGASTFMTNGDTSGLFWQQHNKDTRFGAGVIAQQRRQSSQTGSETTSGRIEKSKTKSKPEAESRSQNEKPSRVLEDSILEDEQRRNVEHTHADIDTRLDNEDEDKRASLPSHDRDVTVESVSGRCLDDGINNLARSANHDQEESFQTQPSPIKIPVEYNEYSVITTPSPVKDTSPSPPHPVTPRSAMKGTRLSLGLPEVMLSVTRRVRISSTSMCVDVKGHESSFRVKKSISHSPGPNTLKVEEVEDLPAADESAESMPPLGAQAHQTPPNRSSWFGWLWGSSSSRVASNVITDTRTAPLHAASNDGPSDPKDEEWQSTKSSMPSTRSQRDTQSRTPCFLLPPSYPSDPNRDPTTPLSTSGDFTKTHFRTLLILHRKSVTSRNFHRPDSIRDGIRDLVGRKFDWDTDRDAAAVGKMQEGRGVFEWRFDEDAAAVVERFMREVEHDWMEMGRRAEWAWSELDLADRLFTLICDEEVRKGGKGLG